MGKNNGNWRRNKTKKAVCKSSSAASHFPHEQNKSVEIQQNQNIRLTRREQRINRNYPLYHPANFPKLCDVNADEQSEDEDFTKFLKEVNAWRNHMSHYAKVNETSFQGIEISWWINEILKNLDFKSNTSAVILLCSLMKKRRLCEYDGRGIKIHLLPITRTDKTEVCSYDWKQSRINNANIALTLVLNRCNLFGALENAMDILGGNNPDENKDFADVCALVDPSRNNIDPYELPLVFKLYLIHRAIEMENIWKKMFMEKVLMKKECLILPKSMN